MNVSIGDTPGSIVYISMEEGVILTSAVTDKTTYPYVYTHAAYDTKTGEQLWVKNRTNIYSMSPRISNIRDGIYAVLDPPKRQIHGYDVKTGAELWVTDPLPSGWRARCQKIM